MEQLKIKFIFLSDVPYVEMADLPASSHASSILSFQLQSKLAAVLLRTRRFADSYYWARNGLNEIVRENNSIHRSRREVSKLAFRSALAIKGMGDIERAVEELRHAMDIEPGNAAMMMELIVSQRGVEEKRQNDECYVCLEPFNSSSWQPEETLNLPER